MEELVVPDFCHAAKNNAESIENVGEPNHDNATTTIELIEDYEEDHNEVDPLTQSDPNSFTDGTKGNPAQNIHSSTRVDGEKSDAVKDEMAVIESVVQDSLENDPMDLLELNDNNSNISTNYDECSDDDGCSSGSSGQTQHSNNVLEWCKEYSWLLYEESDEIYGYCLHCDVKLNVRSLSSVRQHEMSMYHKERSENYLAFRDEEERNNLGTPLFEIKQEFGTDSYVLALKHKRKTQAEALNNYNWRRWLEECPWLERDNPAGTIGRCKYCGVRLNVEFSYLRTRHQEGGKHKEFAKSYGNSLSNKSNADEGDFDHNKISNDRYRWSEPVEGKNSILRCKICDTTIVKNNYLRHLRTISHMENEAKCLKNLKTNKYDKPNAETTTEENENISQKTQHDWDMYGKQHPWLIADPADPTFAYCKYCEKRVLYGSSAAKRATHENSIHHKNQEKTRGEDYGSNQNISDQEDSENDAGGDEEDESAHGEEDVDNAQDEDGDENDQQEENSVKDSTDSKKRVRRGDAKWYEQYPWCKKYKSDPINYCYCSYCKIVIAISSNRSKHCKTARHRAAEAEFKRRQNKKKSLYKSKPCDESYEWAVDIKSQPNLYYCKYCRVRISTRYSKKQHSVSKIHQINQKLFNTNRKNSPKPVKKEPYGEDSKSTIKVPSFITLIKQWQKKFPWLTYKRTEFRSNYAFCKVCEQSLYIRSIKNLLKHQRSGKHARTVNQLRRQRLQEERARNESKNAPEFGNGPKRETDIVSSVRGVMTKQSRDKLDHSPNVTSKESAYKSTIEEMQKRFSWIEKSKKPQYVHCRYCNVDICLKVLFLKNHSISGKHRQAVSKQHVLKSKGENKRTSELDTSNGDDDDVTLVEDNAEEILISEQDDNWTVKSENMDEHEVLDFLLQRSGRSNETNNQRNSKRLKRSHSQRRQNDSNTSLFASILSTPLTLASCLGPLIQQQVQQQITNTTQGTVPSDASILETSNSFDLFFKSVSETMKKLPTDLAAEGKVKVMQIIYELELKAMKRHQQAINETETTLHQNPLDIFPETSSTPNRLHNTADTTNYAEIIPRDNNTHNDVAVPLHTSTPSPVPQQQKNVVSPANVQQQLVVSSPNNIQQQKMVTTSSSVNTPNDGCKEKTLNINSSPIIGIMDKSGIHTLHFKNTTLVKQIPNTNIVANGAATMNSSAIRCIPFKNLSQTVGHEANGKITRIQMPITSTTSSSPQSSSASSSVNAMNTINSTATSRNMLNFRNVQITKRPITQAVASSVATTTIEKHTAGSYITTTNAQRWPNGSSPSGALTKQTTTNFALSPKQTSTPSARKYQ
ncbi:suppressor of variegation 3-7 isoform X2 [Haematobia irritans]|uniref:suppressor of variegation 3-7 isoform X2 n=1 Tax=Haematobia irritans TaxID=7368 RepID=UPI003F506DF1